MVIGVGNVIEGKARLNDSGRIESYRTRVRRVQESMRKYIVPGRCLSDELIADRREEARREMEQDLG
jgi:hypothetical protein